jgi:hypothetical protein
LPPLLASLGSAQARATPDEIRDRAGDDVLLREEVVSLRAQVAQLNRNLQEAGGQPEGGGPDWPAQVPGSSLGPRPARAGSHASGAADSINIHLRACVSTLPLLLVLQDSLRAELT